MTAEKQIFPSNEDMEELSRGALGLLTTMLNIPENDYCTAKELYALSETDKPEDIRTSLVELLDKGYVIIVNGRYAVKKQTILQMYTK